MDLRESLTGIVDELRVARPSRSIELRCPSVRGAWDRDRLDQVFSNLIANAVDYGVEEKPVDVEGQLRQDGCVQVTVHNEGDPIPDDLLSQLFNPFRRGGRDSRAAKTAGLGLPRASETAAAPLGGEPLR
jgi:signal transduction histidine kinase